MLLRYTEEFVSSNGAGGGSLFSFMELNNGSNSSKRPYELHSKATQEEHLWEKKFLSIYVFYTPSLLMQEKEKEKKKEF